MNIPLTFRHFKILLFTARTFFWSTSLGLLMSKRRPQSSPPGASHGKRTLAQGRLRRTSSSGSPAVVEQQRADGAVDVGTLAEVALAQIRRFASQKAQRLCQAVGHHGGRRQDDDAAVTTRDPTNT